MTLQLLDFCLSILTLCSSYMEVPTYLNFKSMNHMVSLGQTSEPLPWLCGLGPLTSPLCASMLWPPGRRFCVRDSHAGQNVDGV